MEKVLVNGGAGFVGRRMCEALLKTGYEVHCVDNIVRYTCGIDPYSGWPLYSPFDFDNFKFIKSDCRDFFENNNDTEYQYAFHLAAMVGGRMMIEHNPIAVAEDLSIDASFWNWAKKVMPKKVVGFSSSAAYPIKLQRKDSYILLREDMIDFSDDIGMPDMSYGWAKLTQEYLARLAYEKHGIKTVIYRPFSGYGEDQDMAYPFPSICKRAIENEGKSIFTVWGSGDQMRDFIHIEDCVKGILSTMDKIDNGEAINLSTGILTSFKEFAQNACEICGYQTSVKGTSDKPEGVFARGGDTTKQHDLGFHHSITFREGIERCINYLHNTNCK